ncbi:hypothetical protein BVRB_2g041390 isoform A [Beta vulgaris subsp. vulgaris]|nr:hypothetical protein BVRB_2g041390 isoform A [Beta vulgaris subsp. vulgaris]
MAAAWSPISRLKSGISSTVYIVIIEVFVTNAAFFVLQKFYSLRDFRFHRRFILQEENEMAIGEAFLSAFLQVVFEKLLSPGVTLFLKLVGAKIPLKSIKQWERKLRMIDALLSDAEQKQFDSSAVKLWLQDVQDLAYDLEDMLDEFATEAQLYQFKAKERVHEPKEHDHGYLGSATNMVQGILCSGSRAAESFSALFNSVTNLSSRIEDISNRLLDIQTQAGHLGLSICVMQQQMQLTEIHCSWRETTSLTPFREGAKGSRVISTTRVEKIARMMIKNPSKSNIIYLEGLSDVDCWCLFQHHASEDVDVSEMRDDILRKCKGLPLAAKALGGLLRSTMEKSQRERILKSNVWSEEGGVLPALRLSYYHLPPPLRRIFSYCSIIPKGHRFLKKEIVLMWMAEGLLREDKEEKMEDIGDIYFLDLISRSLFEPCPSRGFFIMHDLIHDLAQWAAGDICCTNDIQRVCNRTRHFSFTSEVADEALGRLPMAIEEVSQLRTFSFFHNYHTFRCPTVQVLDLFSRIKYLRLLSLAHMKIDVLPDSIGGLRHLRHLDISYTKVLELPESTSELCNLQTLLLKDCTFLRKVVKDLSFMAELRHLNIDGTALQEMPMGIGKLTNLQTLNRFVLGANSGHMIRELKNLIHLRGCLTISGLENVVSDEDAREACLHEKSGLDKLIIIWRTSTYEVVDNKQRDVLDQLQPHKSIIECHLYEYQGLTLPDWLGDSSFTKLVVLTLSFCDRCEWLPPVGQLPSLEKLCIENMHGLKVVGPEFYGLGHHNSDCFPALKILSFKAMNSWEMWLPPSVDSRAFPCLEEISIIDCPLLQGYFPSHLPLLQVLEIKNCFQLSVSLPSLPLLQELIMERCRGLSSTTGVITCSKSISINCITEFTAFEGLWVQGLPRLVVKGESYYPEAGKMLRICKCPKLRTLWPDGYGHLDNLTCVELESCQEQIPFLESNLPSTVRQLSIWNFDNLESITRLTGCCPYLEELDIENCPSLIIVDQLPLTLRRLKISHCQLLQSVELKESPHADFAVLLEDLDIDNCQSLTSLFSRSLQAKGSCSTLGLLQEQESITTIEVSEKRLGLVPGGEGPCELTFLTRLRISKCPGLVSFPEDLLLPRIKKLIFSCCENMEFLPTRVHFPGGGLPRNLIRLDISKVNIAQPIREWGLNLLSCLERLKVAHVGCCSDSIESFPTQEFCLPSSLCTLGIGGFRNLKSISFCSLPNLTRLSVQLCPKLEYFVGNSIPLRMDSVVIEECPLLEQQCKMARHGRIWIHSGRHDLMSIS